MNFKLEPNAVNKVELVEFRLSKVIVPINPPLMFFKSGLMGGVKISVQFDCGI
jgi:hypothetical protein